MNLRLFRFSPLRILLKKKIKKNVYLLEPGLHTTGRGNPFLGGGDLSGSATSHGIDTVAALFGQVLPSGNDHPGFHPGLIGTGESAFAGIGR